MHEHSCGEKTNSIVKNPDIDNNDDSFVLYIVMHKKVYILLGLDI